jgi:hypothetical protein
MLVGAAGFEPATCSTQNYRATRLRHAPYIALTIGKMGSFLPRLQGIAFLSQDEQIRKNGACGRFVFTASGEELPNAAAISGIL